MQQPILLLCGNHFTNNTSPNFSFGHDTEGKWWWVWWSYTATENQTITANTKYTLEFNLTNGSQTMSVNGTQIRSSTYTGKSIGTTPLLLFARNSNSVTASTTVYIKSCKIWENNVLIKHFEVHLSHENAYGSSGFYESVEKKYYPISGAYGYYYSRARNVSKMYVGVSGKARKVKKMYVGVNGKAKQVYPSYTLISFTANPIPTGWSGTTTTADYEFSTSNDYGTWKCSSNMVASSTSYIAWKAFDSSTSTYYRNSSTANNPTVTLFLPTNISINPTKLLLRLYYCGTGTKVEGRIEGTSTWEQIYATTSGTTSATSYTPTVSTSNYYDAFRVVTTQQSSSYARRVYELQLTTGTIKDNR